MNEFDRQAAWRDDIDRRLRVLEGTQRSGLGSIVADGGSGGFTISTFETTNFGADWVDDAAGGTTPEVTIHTGSRVIILATFRTAQVGQAGAAVGVNDFRSAQIVAGVSVDSLEPHEFPAPSMRASFDIAGADLAGGFITVPTTFAPTRSDLVPGEHTFRLKFSAYDTNPSGTVNPLITDTSLIVIPLGWE